MHRFTEKGLPTTREEEWRFTNIAPLIRQPFGLPSHNPQTTLQAAELLQRAVLDDDFHRLVFVNGHYSEPLSGPVVAGEGLIVGSLSKAMFSETARIEHQLSKQLSDESAFTRLNSAFLADGAYIVVPDEVELSQPIHLIFLSVVGERVACHPRNVVCLRRNSKATIIETHLGIGEAAYLSNSVTDIDLAGSAELDHYKLQEEQIGSLHVATTNVFLNESSRFVSHYFSFGAALSRNELNCMLAGEDIECTLNGLYMPTGEQLMDCRTRIDHAKSNCRSNELFKGILDDKSKGVFNGKIYVHPHAQKTNAIQSNQAILLSDDAVIDTKPQLEIYADDVRCTHGATVGELDSQALNYLRSRGIPLKLARAMLIFAFANDIVQGVNVPKLRKHLESLLLADRGLPEV
jgi:Fe-S cluster assembly protein SufD